MAREFDNDEIQVITAFENITGTEVRDCIKNEMLYFLVNSGKAAIAIGKGGQAVQTAEKMMQKPIKVLEWDENPEKFLRNLVPQADKISIKGDTAFVSVSTKFRGAVIGKSGDNIKVIKEFLSRNSEIKDLKIV